eukprot:10400724-Alexandrium_andersonii.AAC.1
MRNGAPNAREHFPAASSRLEQSPVLLTAGATAFSDPPESHLWQEAEVPLGGRGLHSPREVALPSPSDHFSDSRGPIYCSAHSGPRPPVSREGVMATPHPPPDHLNRCLGRAWEVLARRSGRTPALSEPSLGFPVTRGLPSLWDHPVGTSGA